MIALIKEEAEAPIADVPDLVHEMTKLTGVEIAKSVVDSETDAEVKGTEIISPVESQMIATVFSVRTSSSMFFSVHDRRSQKMDWIETPLNIANNAVITIPSHVPRDIQGSLIDVLHGYAEVLSVDDSDIGLSTVIEHAILTGDHPPISCAPYRYSPAQRAAAFKRIKEFEANGDGSGGAEPLRRRLGTAGADKRKGHVLDDTDRTSSSKTAQSTTTAVNKDATPGTDPALFQPQGGKAHEKLLKRSSVWQWVEQGQEALPAGCGEYWLRCRLCSTIFRGSSMKAVHHFLKPQKPCPFRTGEIVDELVSNQRGKVKSTDKNTRYLLKNARGLARCAEGGEEHVQSESDAEDPLSEAVPPPLPGRYAPRLAAQTPATNGEDGEEGDEVPSEAQVFVKPVMTKQTTIKKWIDNQARKELDIA
ncbi:hypothetical protein CBR_g23828 [Chara braunii]|uniref:Uncharacterized protein n=1 Tax=Chara braunii TaxID=69332 RepID=A0A388JVP3_CHABU|nr:hypothetical protein CBR_g23828 [Chara braunii]|eukprot:GBG61876.1 hypothetical protein CBR_g23828 [Chara braunii]